MALPLTSLPVSFVAGDTFDVSMTLTDFPAPTWSASLYLTGYQLITVSIAAVASGTDQRFTVAAAVTALWAAGTYTWTLKVSGTSTHAVQTGLITVLTNPATASASTDDRSHARKALDLIEAAIENRLPNGLESYNIAGRDIRKISLLDLLKLKDRYAAIVASEEAKLLGQSGLRSHLFKFVNR